MTKAINIPMTIAIIGVIGPAFMMGAMHPTRTFKPFGHPIARPGSVTKPDPVMTVSTYMVPVADPHVCCHLSLGIPPPMVVTPDITRSCHITHRTTRTMITTIST
jgi:hypothetical protein